jgi:hypothetical protein
LVSQLSGGVQNIEKEEECSDIEKRERSGGSKNEKLMEMEALAIERIERTAKGLRMAHKKGQDWISMR